MSMIQHALYRLHRANCVITHVGFQEVIFWNDFWELNVFKVGKSVKAQTREIAPLLAADQQLTRT